MLAWKRSRSAAPDFVIVGTRAGLDQHLLERGDRPHTLDMGLYVRGDTDRSPARPKGYFTAEAETELRALERRAREDRRRLTLEDLTKIDALAPTEASWRNAAISFYSGWIELITTATGSANASQNEPALFQNVSETRIAPP